MEEFIVPVVIPGIEITTPRLVMRQWCEEDLAPFAAMNADPKVMEYFPATLTREQSDDMAQRCSALIAERGWGIWALETREDGKFIGFLGLHTPGYNLPFTPCVEIGWRLCADAWGKGLASEAARAAFDVGFNRLNLNEIVAFTALPNIRSQALMQRMGMSLSPDENFDHPAVEAGSWLQEHCLYRLHRDDWVAVQSRL
ncbi:GCN5 family N-acetyltransferase [Enterobacterales bacterium]|nr:GCN5 family N-acetyltransferase [Enterobacterales bacterium]